MFDCTYWCSPCYAHDHFVKGALEHVTSAFVIKKCLIFEVEEELYRCYPIFTKHLLK